MTRNKYDVLTMIASGTIGAIVGTSGTPMAAALLILIGSCTIFAVIRALAFRPWRSVPTKKED